MENKMKSFVCAAAMLALAGAASAGNFSIGAVDASDGTIAGGRPGTGIDVTGGSIYQDGFGSPSPTGEPSQAFIGLVPSLEFDSYVTIDRGPVQPAPGYDGTGYDGAQQAPGSTGFTATSYRGSWFRVDPAGFSQAAAVEDKPGVNYQLFLGRITHTGTLSGKIAVAIAEENSPGFTTIEGDIVTEDNIAAGLITHDVDGALLVKPQVTPDRGYAFVAKQFEVVIGSTTYTVTDIFLQNVVIPTPGAMGLLGVAGVAAVRRRRR